MVAARRMERRDMKGRSSTVMMMHNGAFGHQIGGVDVVPS